jgi:hypothetical protein
MLTYNVLGYTQGPLLLQTDFFFQGDFSAAA